MEPLRPVPGRADEVVIDDLLDNPLEVVTQDSNATTPTLLITHVPLYGSEEWVCGEVVPPTGSSLDYTKYRVTLYLQISDGDTCWVKPIAGKSYSSVEPDGSFSIQYSTDSDGNDSRAKNLFVLLIPSTYTPTVNGIDAARSQAIDSVTITRDSNGSYAVSPAGREGEYRFTGKPSGLTVSSNKIALNVGLYTTGNNGDPLSETQIRTMLNRVAKVADTVRLYKATGAEATACRIAHELGLKVAATAALDNDAANNQKQMDALVDLCKKGFVQVAVVGNETLWSGKLTPEQLVANINYVRNALAAAGVGDNVVVTTSETLGCLIDNPYVCNTCDILVPQSYPYHEGVGIDDAPTAFAGAVQALANSCPGKEIVVGETGWPTAGSSQGTAVAGEAQARAYFDAVRSWSLDTNTVVWWFAGMDEQWKSSPAGEGDYGAHWGLMDTNLKLKDGFKSVKVLAPLAVQALSNKDITLAKTSYTYNGKAIKPSVTVTHDSVALKAGTDYTLKYTNNTNAGTAKITAKGKGDYEGSATATFTINKAANPLAVTTNKAKVSVTYNASKKQVTARNVTASGAVGTVSYYDASTNATAKKLSVNTSSGKVTVPKGTHVGTYTFKAKVTAAGDANHKAGTKYATYKIAVTKAANPLKVTVVTKTTNANKTYSKAVALKPITVKGAKGKVRYKKISGSSVLSVNASTGKVSVAKGTKAGTYSAKVKVTAAGTSNYKARSKNVTVKVVVKAATATLSISHVPAYGVDENVRGVVKPPAGEKLDHTKYRVTLYLQVSDGDTYWIKPYFSNPFVKVGSNGEFSIDYATGGYDLWAKHLYVLLIPSTYNPKSHDFDFDEDSKKAIDLVSITRSKNGTHTIKHQRP